MLKGLQLHRSKKNHNSHKKFLEEFYTQIQHQWILLDNKILNTFYPFLLKQNLDVLSKKKTIFLKIRDKISATFTPKAGQSYILIFPELYSLLESSHPEYGLAILAHEIGHLVYAHNEKKISSLKARIEADSYAYSVGYGQELMEILSDNIDIEGTKERLIHLKKLHVQS